MMVEFINAPCRRRCSAGQSSGFFARESRLCTRFCLEKSLCGQRCYWQFSNGFIKFSVASCLSTKLGGNFIHYLHVTAYSQIINIFF